MALGEFILGQTTQIVSEWEQFARSCLPAADNMDLEARRDHVVGMLRAIAADLATPQTEHQQEEKGKGGSDARLDSDNAATAHGTDRAATGTHQRRWWPSSERCAQAFFVCGPKSRASSIERASKR